MGIMVITGRYLPKPSANGVCIDNIIQELKKRYPVTVLASNHTNLNLYDEYGDIKVFRVKYRKAHFGKLSHPFSKGLGAVKLFFKYNVSVLKLKDYISTGMRVIDDENTQLLISVARPFESIYAAMAIKRIHPKIKTVLIFFDFPATFDYKVKFFQTLWKKRTDRMLDEVFLSFDKVIFMKYQKSYLAENPIIQINSNKTVYLDLPCFVPQTSLASCIEADKKFIRIVYTGSLDHKFRDPGPVLESCFERLPSLSNRLQFDFYSSGCEDVLDFYKSKYPDNIILHGLVSPEESDAALLHADILLNIGNKGVKQLPSKIFKYFSTGKPILNFYFDEDDMGIPYFEKYKNALNINVMRELDVCKITDYIINHRSITDNGLLKNLFRDNMPDTYCKEIEELI